MSTPLARMQSGILVALLLIGSAPPTSAQVLAQQGDHFTVDGRPRFLLFISYFDGMRRANAGGSNTGDLDTDFAYLKSIGIDGIRVLPNWKSNCAGVTDDGQKLFTTAGTINESMWPVFLRLLNRAAIHGLLVDVTFTRETYSTPIPVAAYQSAIVTVAQRLRDAGGYRHVLFDIQNEYPLHGLTATNVHDILSAVHAADASRIATASGGSGQIVNDAEMNTVAYHDPRNSDWFEATTAQTQFSNIRIAIGQPIKPIYYQEPMPFRPCADGSGISQDPTVGHARLAAKHAKQYGAAAWTFHTRQSFTLAGRSLSAILQSDANQKAELEAIFDSANSVGWGASTQKRKAHN
jgi:hypothetical protein